jgi:hypothetical protein
MYNSDISMDINWGPPVTASVAAIHLKSGSDPYGTTWRINEDGGGPSYQPSIFLDDGAISIGSAVYAMAPYVNAYNGGALPALYSGVEWHGLIGGKDTLIQSSVINGTKSIQGPELTTIQNQNSYNLITNGTPTLGTAGQQPPGWETGHTNTVIALATDPNGVVSQNVVYSTSASGTSPPGPVTNTFELIPGQTYWVKGWYITGGVGAWAMFFTDGSGYSVGMPGTGYHPTSWTAFNFLYTIPKTGTRTSAKLLFTNVSATSDWIKMWGLWAGLIPSSYLSEGVTYGTLPTCAVTGFATSEPVCGLTAGSNDNAGFMYATASTGSAASGTFTLTFSTALGTNYAVCTFNLFNNGSGTWNPRATVITRMPSTAAAPMTWDNNSAALTSAQTYAVNYHCFGM